MVEGWGVDMVYFEGKKLNWPGEARNHFLTSVLEDGLSGNLEFGKGLLK